MPQDHVRVCPVCERENPPERTRCACGALLTGVDFSVRRPPPADPPPGAAEDHATAAAGAASDDRATVPEAAAAAEAAAAPALVVCPYADCAQPNPAGGERCVYCNRPLRPASPAVAGARPLPSALRDAYRVVDVFPATGGEADILLVADAKTGERRVAKLYRRGIAPDFRLLDILAQAVGDTVVRVLAHGVSDGAAYELLEYVPGGTLQDLMRAGPLPKADIRRIVKEVADALNGIHAHRILHRDLKPENVLIRSKAPLELALTDFGIASISEATQHFTTAARTTKYAAPEVLTGVLDAKSDWWSLGMIALEAASGRHPFEGLTEQVMNHHLATRPIDVRGVYDDDLRMLCRGLLLRDPKRRWGGDEVARWLAGDPALAVPDDADGVATAVRPYRLGKTEATTGAELALALARHWDAGCRDLARGQVARWLEQELHDYNLLRALRDIQDQRGTSDDARLLRFIVAAAPDLPAVWRGSPVSEAAVLAAAHAAASDDGAAQDWLDSLHRDGVLATYADAGQPPLRDLDRRWRDAWRQFSALWDAARRAEEQWRAQPRDVGGGAGSGAVSFDDLAFVATGKLAPPPQRAVNGPLLLALTDAAYADALRGEVAGGLARVAGYCPWFEALWESVQHDPVGVVAARQLLPQAQDDAALETKRQSATAGARARAFDEARDALRASLAEVLALAPTGDEDLAHDTAARLLDAFNGFHAACQNVLRFGDGGDDFDELRRALEKLSQLALSAQRALAEAEQVGGVNAIFLAPQRLLVGGAVIGVALLLRVPAALLVVLAAVALVVAYRWYAGFRSTEAALAKLRLFGLSARTFLRSGPSGAEKADDKG
ncbi:MAG: protein kinase [Burkholderiales bacterium]